MSDFIWETFDGLFKTVHRQTKQVEQLEQRVVELERRLSERDSEHNVGAVTNIKRATSETAFPTERAA